MCKRWGNQSKAYSRYCLNKPATTRTPAARDFRTTITFADLEGVGREISKFLNLYSKITKLGIGTPSLSRQIFWFRSINALINAFKTKQTIPKILKQCDVIPGLIVLGDRGHFKTILIFLRRRALYKDIGKWTKFKAKELGIFHNWRLVIGQIYHLSKIWWLTCWPCSLLDFTLVSWGTCN